MKSSRVFQLFLLLTIGILSSCSIRPRANSDPTAIPEVEETALVPEYRLGFGDVIEVKFFNNERFNETVAVRPDGRITLEKMGDILVTGMTPSQLDSLITVTYSEFVRNPEITVFVRQFGGYQVYVLGEVNSPGGYPIQRNMTLLQALAAAGGPKNTAKLGSVLILRRGERGGVDALKVNLTKPLNGTDGAITEDHLHVQPQDVVYVSKTFVSNISTFMDQVWDGFLPPVDLYLRALWWSNR